MSKRAPGVIDQQVAEVVPQYIVVREWKTERRLNRVAAGPFSSRSKAQAFARRHGRMNVYDSTIYVVVFHQLT